MLQLTPMERTRLESELERFLIEKSRHVELNHRDRFRRQIVVNRNECHQLACDLVNELEQLNVQEADHR